jgi:dihydrofolate reductase
MAKLLYSFTMSLDGYIAGPDGDMSWLGDYLATPNPVAEKLVSDIGCLLVGANTNRGDDPNRGTDRERAFNGTWSGPVYVVTHHPPESDPTGDASYLNDLDAAIAQARTTAGDRYVNVLGADLARQCLERGEVEEILAFIAPVLLGDGVRVLSHHGGTRIRLERLDDMSTATTSECLPSLDTQGRPSRSRASYADGMQRARSRGRVQYEALQQETVTLWQRLIASPPDVVLAVLGHAFESSSANAAPLGVWDTEAHLVLLAPDLAALPERYPTTTAAGNLPLRKFTKGEMADLYKQLVAGLVLATAKETFSVARE